MKKTSILIAMFAVITAASAARAEIDFDGRATSAITFMEAVKAIEVSQDIKPAQEKLVWPLEDMPCASASMCGGMHYLADDCTCKPLPGYEDFYNHISSSAWWASALEDASRQPPAGVQRRAAVRNLAGYYQVRKDLHDIILAQFNVHDNFSSNIFHVLQDEKTVILHNANGVYLVNGNTLYGTNNKELARNVMEGMGRRTRMGLEDVGLAIIIGCAFSDDCREDVANYIENLHDDEHDTYHNNHDGSNPNYEVNKKVN